MKAAQTQWRMAARRGRIDPRQCDGNGSERDQYRGDHERQRWPHAASVEQELSNGLSGVERNHIAGQHGPACLRLRTRSEEHTSELQSLMRISYAVFCLKKKKQ